jgi:hypothetical protein
MKRRFPKSVMHKSIDKGRAGQPVLSLKQNARWCAESRFTTAPIQVVGFRHHLIVPRRFNDGFLRR